MRDRDGSTGRARRVTCGGALLAVLLLACGPGSRAPAQTPEAGGAGEGRPDWALAIHGGAGTILREDMTPERERAYREALEEALAAGAAILSSGGTSLDAVEAVIRLLEDSPLFNAGVGAVFTHEGANELDASVMRGSDLAAGAVAGVRHVKNPISLARRVMEASPHVLLAGDGAEEFALEQGLELVPREYFFTEPRWRSLQRALEAERRAGAGPILEAYGTVGAVALDTRGGLAAGTSTGGMTNKRFGRIGDSPIIGAGTYADDRACAVSGTGHGEFFIRNAVAYDICARVLYLGATIDEAATAVVMERLVEQGGQGGVIAIDPAGNVVMPFNTPGMYRGFVTAGAEPVVRIFREDGS